MQHKILFLILVILLSCHLVIAQTATPEELLKGVNFIPTTQYTEKENAEILELYKNLRVADVSDGMDMVGLPNTGLMEQSIHPDWVDTQTMKHVIRGIALTVRYVPTQRPDRPKPDEDFAAWEGHFYNTYSAGIYGSIIKPGTILMIDDVEAGDVGTIGSNNILSWVANGAVGVITDAGARDTDEVALQKVPLYLRHKSRGIRPGRNELESINRPICMGGVLVCPGDVVVADGDGVIVVPRKVAKQVALNAQKILDNDKQGRRNLYKKLGLPMDQTVE